MRKLLIRAAVVVFTTAIGRGIVLATHLDTLVAAMIPVEGIKEYSVSLSWIMSGLFGLVCLAAWSYRRVLMDFGSSQNPIAGMTSHPTVFAKRDADVKEGLAYIGSRTWGQSFTDQILAGAKDSVERLDTFRQAATDSEITIWGKKSKYVPYTKIDAKYWEEWQLHYLSLLKTETSTEPTVSNPSDHQVYYDLMISKGEFETKWPPEQVTPNSTHPELMDLIELRDIFRKMPEWNFAEQDLQYIDLAKAFREAAYRKKFTVWGKKMPPEGLFKEEVISLKIPEDFWVDGGLDMFRFPNATSNQEIVTHVMEFHKRKQLPVYFDLEVEKIGALKWARSDESKKYKGESAAVERQRLEE